MHGAVQLHLGIIALNLEELTIGEEHFTKCGEIIQNHDSLPETASVTLNMYHHLGILWSKRDEEKSKENFKKASVFYTKIKSLGITPIDYNDIFSTTEETNKKLSMEKFNETQWTNLYHFSQITGVIDNLKLAAEVHRTFQRKLESGNYDQIDWILHNLSQCEFLMEKNGFKQARHHLSASSYMLNAYKADLDASGEQGEAFDAKMAVFKHRSADVARAWGNYGLTLLSSSHLLLSKNFTYRHPECIDETARSCTDITKMSLKELNTRCNILGPLTRDDLENLGYPTLSLSKYEEQVTDRFVVNFEEAKVVFLNALKWLMKAKEYYTLDTLAAYYILIAQDHSKLYNYLGFFEKNPDNKAKLMKRAADILEKVVGEVNPTYYKFECQQMWFQVGIFYSNILDIKLDKLRDSALPNLHAIKKVNMLVTKSSQFFWIFLDSFKDAQGEMPSWVPAVVERPYMEAYLQIAMLQTKYRTLDKRKKLELLETGLSACKKYFEYMKMNEKAVENVKEEKLLYAMELLTNMPLEIARLKNELAANLENPTLDQLVADLYSSFNS